jgi:hypothetical protein
MMTLAMQQTDALVSTSAVAWVAAAKIRPTSLHQRVDGDLLSSAELPNHSLKIDPAFLRIDFKQNLLVWPNVAGDLTRSPPSCFRSTIFLNT